MWNKFKLVTMALLISSLIGCKAETTTTEKLNVGTMSGPETEMMHVAKDYAKERFNLYIEIIEFQDYATTDAAVADKSIDANATQTVQFFEQWKKAHGDDSLMIVANTFIYPMGMYSNKLKSLSDLAPGSTVAIPNDPSNEERALLLLEKAGLITLKQTNETKTINDVAENPLQLNLETLAPAQLPRVLDDVAIAVINNNYAVPAGLSPTENALFAEGKDSPYANIIITRRELQNDPRIAHLIEAYHSQAVLDKAKELFKGQAIPAW